MDKVNAVYTTDHLFQLLSGLRFVAKSMHKVKKKSIRMTYVDSDELNQPG